MVIIEIAKDENDNVTAYRVEGHAGYDVIGQDIVCAGVSAITFTALVGLMKYLKTKPVFKMDEGLLACTLAPGTGDDDKVTAAIILGTMEKGLEELEFRYHEHIKLNIRRC